MTLHGATNRNHSIGHAALRRQARHMQVLPCCEKVLPWGEIDNVTESISPIGQTNGIAYSCRLAAAGVGRISLQSPSAGEVRRKAEAFGETGKAEMFGETDDMTSALGGGQYLVALH